MDLNEAERNYELMLKRLCQDVSKERWKCPTPEVLTAALRGLFPSCWNHFLPQGVVIAIRDTRKAYCYADIEKEVLPANAPEVLELRRHLSAYIEVPLKEPQ